MYSNNKNTHFSKIITDLYLLLPTSFTEWNAQEKRNRLFNLELSVSLIKSKIAILSYFHYLTNNGVNIDLARSGEIYCNFNNKSVLHKTFKTFKNMVNTFDTHFEDQHLSIDFDEERKVLIYKVKDQYLSDIEGSKGKFRINYEEINSKSLAKISLQAFLLSQQGQDSVTLKEGFIAALTNNLWEYGNEKDRAQKRRNIKNVVNSISAGLMIAFNAKTYTYTFKIVKRTSVEIIPMAAKKIGVSVMKLANLVKAVAKQTANKAVEVKDSFSQSNIKAFEAVINTHTQTQSLVGIQHLAVTDGTVIDYDNQIPF